MVTVADSLATEVADAATLSGRSPVCTSDTTSAVRPNNVSVLFGLNGANNERID
jgi:hypothetical protein